MRLRFAGLIYALSVIACLSGSNVPKIGPTPRPTRTPLPPPQIVATDNEQPLAETTITPPEVTIQPGWEPISPGLELRVAWMWISGVSGPVELTILRINPSVVDLRVHAALNNSATVSGWADRTGALALINGAFFEPGKRVLGLLVEDGLSQGEPFDDHGGILTVSGSDVRIRALGQEPVQPGETFDYAISGRPMLLYPGGIPATFNLSPEASRRTVVAQDRDGNILFMVNDFGAVSLYYMRDWLATTPELNLTTAFNLDGGGSTGIAIRVPGHELLIDSWWDVATVVAVYPKP